jgi:hypothetical protein
MKIRTGSPAGLELLNLQGSYQDRRQGSYCTRIIINYWEKTRGNFVMGQVAKIGEPLG